MKKKMEFEIALIEDLIAEKGWSRPEKVVRFDSMAIVHFPRRRRIVHWSHNASVAGKFCKRLEHRLGIR